MYKSYILDGLLSRNYNHSHELTFEAGVEHSTSLYKALSGERTPGFDTILKVVSALGLKLHAEAAHS